MPTIVGFDAVKSSTVAPLARVPASAEASLLWLRSQLVRWANTLVKLSAQPQPCKPWSLNPGRPCSFVMLLRRILIASGRSFGYHDLTFSIHRNPADEHQRDPDDHEPFAQRTS